MNNNKDKLQKNDTVEHDDDLTDSEREILRKIDALPPEKLEETKLFIDFLLSRQKKETGEQNK